MTSLQMRDHILDRLKVELKRIAFLSHDDYSFGDKINIMKEELGAVKYFLSNR